MENFIYEWIRRLYWYKEHKCKKASNSNTHTQNSNENGNGSIKNEHEAIKQEIGNEMENDTHSNLSDDKKIIFSNGLSGIEVNVNNNNSNGQIQCCQGVTNFKQEWSEERNKFCDLISYFLDYTMNYAYILESTYRIELSLKFLFICDNTVRNIIEWNNVIDDCIHRQLYYSLAFAKKDLSKFKVMLNPVKYAKILYNTGLWFHHCCKSKLPQLIAPNANANTNTSNCVTNNKYHNNNNNVNINTKNGIKEDEKENENMRANSPSAQIIQFKKSKSASLDLKYARNIYSMIFDLLPNWNLDAPFGTQWMNDNNNKNDSKFEINSNINNNHNNNMKNNNEKNIAASADSCGLSDIENVGYALKREYAASYFHLCIEYIGYHETKNITLSDGYRNEMSKIKANCQGEIGSLYFECNNFDKARKMFNQVVSQFKQNSSFSILYNYSLLLFIEKKYSKAQGLCAHAMEKLPGTTNQSSPAQCLEFAQKS